MQGSYRTTLLYDHRKNEFESFKHLKNKLKMIKLLKTVRQASVSKPMLETLSHSVQVGNEIYEEDS